LHASSSSSPQQQLQRKPPLLLVLLAAAGRVGTEALQQQWRVLMLWRLRQRR
jgi:hypothetical protein